MSGQPLPLLVGLSGVSSSGKTTLARLLRDIWPRTTILHQDDFYFSDDRIPVKNGVADWDCVEAIDVDKFERALVHIKEHGTLPGDLESLEDQNSVGDTKVDHDAVQCELERVSKVLSHGIPRQIFIIDGFLLYSMEMRPVWEKLDVKLFLRTSYSKAKSRREARTGYVTIEGFWEDPPGYVDMVVWPNYVKDHAFLFVNGDVEGPLNLEVCRRMDIKPVPADAEDDMTKCLLWASEVLESALRNPL